MFDAGHMRLDQLMAKNSQTTFASPSKNTGEN